ncbi:uncharacterized protein KY384_005906 [Bacidia gigantensis]|uniref:uncharacterized protein n=1 Tax=Bacidia gigantensis TaxID=2732470 RepID=UPI001D04A65C|nr:uncharacterized protein KY384_005906 [Bacidia gigantensis]KAG8529271.1 hypothetical protein KY384_005906 [Bacidia gigantensis]
MASPTQFAYRTPKDVGIIQGPPTYEALQGFEPVTVAETSTGAAAAILPTQNVFEIGFSPLGTYIITWERPSKDDCGDATKNLKVWRVVEGSQDVAGSECNVVGRFVQKSATGWNLQYTHDELYCARAVTNEVHFYQSSDLAIVWNKLRVEGLTDFAISSGHNPAIAVFTPERKGLPASVKIFGVPQFTAPMSQKNFFKGDKVQLKWNKDGTSLIVLAQTDVDKSGKSYYGETTLYLLSAEGDFDSRIGLGRFSGNLKGSHLSLMRATDKDGPIHDVTWSPNSKEFGVVYGYMPAKTTLFNTEAKATYTFPLSPRNTILFSPNGRLVLVAGFGNLAGQMDVYDLEKDHTKICAIEASNASVCEWSPDGQFILTATTSPRLRVDNGVKIWHVGGGLMYTKDLHELYHVIWRPRSTVSPFSDTPDALPIPHTSVLEYMGKVRTPVKAAGAYRPPGARGQITPLAFKREDEGGAAYVSNGSLSQGISMSNFGKARRREVPGADPVDKDGQFTRNVSVDDEHLSKAAAKNKKKRDARKAKDPTPECVNIASSTDETTIAHASPSRPPRADGANGSQKPKPLAIGETSPQPRQADLGSHKRLPRAGEVKDTVIATPRGGTTAIPGAGDGGGVSLHDKKIRALLKKLRAIDDLRMRRAGGEILEGTQIKKMDTEEAVRKELEDLGYQE